MITTCPHCQTAFQINAEQLGAKAGLVRCGACMQVFNGYRGLTLTPPAAAARDVAGSDDTQAQPNSAVSHAQVDTAEAGVAAAAEESRFAQTPSDVQTTQPARSLLLLPVEPLDASVPAAIAEAEALLDAEQTPQQSLDLDLSGDDAPAAWPPSTPQSEPVLGREHAQPIHANERARPEDTPVARETSGAQVSERERSPQPVGERAVPRVSEPLYRPELHVPQTSPAWLVASAVLLAALALQAVYFWRGAIAQYWPATRAHLEAACASVGCDVQLAQELAQLNIEASTLEADPERPGVVVLQTTLQNLALFVQRYPLLELTLTGVNDEVLGVKTFSPNEYLRDVQDARLGWPPKQTRAVALHLDVSALPPAGFRLRLLYP